MVRTSQRLRPSGFAPNNVKACCDKILHRLGGLAQLIEAGSVDCVGFSISP